MRTLVIGDIHGAYEALMQCLERSNFDREKDELINLGDVCDSWPDVKRCVDELLKIKNAVHLLGNHDEWFKRWLQCGIHPDGWTQGGSGTLQSYDTDGDWWLNPGEVPGPHWQYFMQARWYYHDEDRNYFFVHGGFDRRLSIAENREKDPSVFWWDRDLWYAAMSTQAEEVKLKTVDDFDRIFIGHTATTSWTEKETRTERGFIIPSGKPITTPIYAGGVWNLDTGAGWNGKLTIMDVDTKQYWQSDPVQTLYAEEANRRFRKNS